MNGLFENWSLDDQVDAVIAEMDGVVDKCNDTLSSMADNGDTTSGLVGRLEWIKQTVDTQREVLSKEYGS